MGLACISLSKVGLYRSIGACAVSDSSALIDTHLYTISRFLLSESISNKGDKLSYLYPFVLLSHGIGPSRQDVALWHERNIGPAGSRVYVLSIQLASSFVPDDIYFQFCHCAARHQMRSLTLCVHPMLVC